MEQGGEMNAEGNFLEAVTRQSLVNPYAAEESALKARPPGQLHAHEQVRLQRLTSFRSLFSLAQPAYHTAAAKGNWQAAAPIAQKVAAAAQALRMSVVLLLLAVVAGAQQTLPQQVSDTASSENMDYLATQLRTQAASLASVDGSSHTWTGYNSWSGQGVVSSTFIVTLNGSAVTTANAIYANLLPKAAACFDGTGSNGTAQTIKWSVNVSSVNRVAAGRYTVTFGTPFASVDYVVSGTCNDTGATHLILIGSRNPDAFGTRQDAISCESNGGTYTAAAEICAVWLGAQ